MGGKAAKERRRLKRLGMESTAKEESNAPKNTRKSETHHADNGKMETNEAMHTPRPGRTVASSNRRNAVTRIMAKTGGGSFPRNGDNTRSKQRRGARGAPPARYHPVSSRGGPSGTLNPPRSFNHRNDPNRRPFENGKHLTSRRCGVSETTKKKTKVAKPKHLKRKLEQADNDETRTQLQKEIQAFEDRKQAYSTKKARQAPKRQKTSDTVREAPNAVSTSTVQPSSSINLGTSNLDRPKSESTIRSFNQHAEASSVDPNEAPAPTPSIVSDKLGSDKTDVTKSDSDSDSDTSVGVAKVKRQRGRKRRGRRGAASAPTGDTKEHSGDEHKEAIAQPSETVSNESLEEEKAEENQQQLHPTKKMKSDGRRCLGRKPVTDYHIGDRYDGTVVYILKPFGVFIDIGCHSDAFCHVSRIQDDYVESPQSVLRVGEKVSARVVEIDRSQKRLTVSLQSDARIADEHVSSEAKKLRAEKRKEKKSEQELRSKNRCKDEGSLSQNRGFDYTNNEVNSAAVVETSDLPLDESQMTQAQLKRARKLARRAERRAQKELTGISA